MSIQDNGGPAFPTANYPEEIVSGMYLRDYFAAKAMQGNLASMVEGQEFDPAMGAAWSYKVADAMLAARGAA